MSLNCCKVVFIEITSLNFQKLRAKAFLQLVFSEKARKHIVQATVNRDVILNSKNTKVFVMWSVGSWLSFEQKKTVFLCQRMQINKNYL